MTYKRPQRGDPDRDRDGAWGAPDKPDFDSGADHPESGAAGFKGPMVAPRDPAEWGSTSNDGREAYAEEIRRLATQQYGKKDYENE